MLGRSAGCKAVNALCILGLVLSFGTSLVLATTGQVNTGQTRAESEDTDQDEAIRLVRNPPVIDNALVTAIHESARMADLISILDETLLMPHELLIQLAADEGPLFDPVSNEIRIPDAFIEEVADRFSAADHVEQDDLLLLVEDVMLHTLIHEIGHALVANYGIPVLGREEDAVDALATLLLIEFYEDGHEVALSAAEMFAMESEDSDTIEEADFRGEHSLDAQRYYATLCHVHGSSPEDFPDLLDLDDGESADSLAEVSDRCVNEYELLSENWFSLLDPHLQ